MSSFLHDIAKDHREMERELGVDEVGGNVNVTWGGNDYPCSFSTLSAAATLMLGGYVENQTLTIRIRMQSCDRDSSSWDWTAGGGPAEGQSIIFRSKTYKITATRDIHNKLMVLSCADPNA